MYNDTLAVQSDLPECLLNDAEGPELKMPESFPGWMRAYEQLDYIEDQLLELFGDEHIARSFE